MSLPLSLAVYFTTWWIVLFAVLPFGVRSHYEAGEVGPLPRGVEKAAPVAPMMLKKFVWTTIIAAVVFAGIDVYATWFD